MLYWIVFVLLAAATLVLTGGTMFHIKKDKKKQEKRTSREREEERRPRRRREEEEYLYDDGYDEEEYAAEREMARPKRVRRWKIILEDLDTWKKYTFIFVDNVGIGRSASNAGYEQHLALTEDPKVSKQHCAVVAQGDMIYLRDENSRNGTYLNGARVTARPEILQKGDVIGAGQTRLEVVRVMRESA